MPTFFCQLAFTLNSQAQIRSEDLYDDLYIRLRIQETRTPVRHLGRRGDNEQKRSVYPGKAHAKQYVSSYLCKR